MRLANRWPPPFAPPFRLAARPVMLSLATGLLYSEMLQIRIEIIVLLCDIVLAGSGVALLATGCQSQRGGPSPSAPPPKYATGGNASSSAGKSRRGRPSVLVPVSVNNCLTAVLTSDARCGISASSVFSTVAWLFMLTSDFLCGGCSEPPC